MSTTSDTTDPALALYEELVLKGEAPAPEAFCARYPERPDLHGRIAALEEVRGDLERFAGLVLGRPPEPPEEIGGYRLGARLGQGGMGAVFSAEDSQGKLRALKLLNLRSSIALVRFRREAEVVRGLSHPGLTKLLAFGVENRQAFIVTELVQGRTLRDLLENDSPPAARPGIRRICCLVQQVAQTLGYAHRLGVVHRDVKPSNVMIDVHGRTKVIDFGIALSSAHKQRVTMTGVFVGSHNYAAPEQLKGWRSDIGPWTDTYALGATLFELLAHRTPFEAQSFEHRLGWADEPPERGPRHFNSAVPRSLNALVLRALSPNLEKRFQNGDAMARALKRWCA